MKNQYIGGDCLKRGGLGQFVGLRGGAWLGKKEGVVFLRGVDTPMLTMIKLSYLELVIDNRFTKIKFKYFNGNCDYSSWPG